MSSFERCIVNLDRWYLRSLKREMTWQCNKTYHKWLSQKEWEQDRQFPLLLSVKVLALSPKQPHAPSNNHARSSSVLIWKRNSISLTHIASASDLSSSFSAGAQLIYSDMGFVYWLKWGNTYPVSFEADCRGALNMLEERGFVFGSL